MATSLNQDPRHPLAVAPGGPLRWQRGRGPGRVCKLAGLAALVAGGAVAASTAPASAASARTTPDDVWAYTVLPGDTLIGIRDRLLAPQADWRVVQRLNRIARPRRLQIGTVLHLPVGLLAEQPLAAEVLHVQGDVWRQAGSAPERLPLAAGQALAAGDWVATGPRSSAVILWADGTRLLLRPDSRLRLVRSVLLGRSGQRETGLQLESGSADTQVVPGLAPAGAAASRPPLQLRTPLVNLAVRGTEFRTLVSVDRTQVEVLDGQVAVAPPGAAPTPGAGGRPGAGSRQGAGSALLIGAGFGTVASASGLAPARALLGVPGLGALPLRIERLPLSLAWPAQPGAATYRAQVFDADAPHQLRLDGLFVTPVARWPDDLPDGRYALRVRGADADGLEGRDASALFTLKARPEPPFVTEPQAGSRTPDALVTFRWARNPAASHYRLQLADNPGFDPVRDERADLVATDLRLALPVGTHHWRLASVRGADDTGPWGDAQTITRLQLPPPPDALPPQASADGVLLAWARSPGDGTRYRVQLARDASFSPLLADEQTAQPSWLLRRPEPGTYHVRVQVIDADGLAGEFGAAQQIDVPPPATSGWWWLLPALLLLLV